MPKFIKISIAILTLLITTTNPVMAQAPTQIDQLITLDNKDEMIEFVGIKASEYNVSKSLMICFSLFSCQLFATKKKIASLLKLNIKLIEII